MSKLLILSVDRDNDLYEKAKVRGPILGREETLNAALKLALADPEDADANALFYAVKLYDQLKKEHKDVEIVILTGDKKLGYRADRKISEQLDMIVDKTGAKSCILVTDGVADNETLPIIKSRLKIDSTKIVIVKQAKELEKTYFVLLEKLKDPYFARIIIGIPAILILLFSLSSYFGFGLEPIGIIIGLYLLMRLFSIDERISDFVREFKFSFESSSWITYISAVVIFGLSVLIAFQSITRTGSLLLTIEKRIAIALGSVSWVLFTGVLLIMLGKSIDAIKEGKKYKISKYVLYSSASFLISTVVWVGSQWVANISKPYVDFGLFLITLILAIFGGYFAHSLSLWYKRKSLSDMPLKGKEVILSDGTYIGKVKELTEDFMLVKGFGREKRLALLSIKEVDDKIVV